MVSEATISLDCHAGKRMSFSYEQTSVFAVTRAKAASSEPYLSHGSERSIDLVMCRYELASKRLTNFIAW